MTDISDQPATAVAEDGSASSPAAPVTDAPPADPLLDSIVRVALVLFREIDGAVVTVIDGGGHVVARAGSGPDVLALDRLQDLLDEGPRLDAWRTRSPVRIDPARHEQRWPRVVHTMLREGVRAQLYLCLTDGEIPLGVLTLSSRSAGGWPRDDARLAEVIGEHAGLTLANARRVEGLHAALASRKAIGMALGILMQRLDLDEDSAFSYLTRLSASTQTKLRDVAVDIVEQQRRGQDPVRPPPAPGSSPG